MTRKLLSRTLRVYVYFALIVVALSAPLFYLFSDKLFIDDADEALMLRKREFVEYNLPTLRLDEISTWNRFNRDVKIEPVRLSLKRDTILYKFFIDTLANNENEPYRVLYAPVMIEGRVFTLMARINLVESQDMIGGIAMLFTLMLSILLIGLFFLTRRMSKKLWRPFYSTLQQVEQFDLDKNTQVHFLDSDVEEFVRLNQSVKDLLEKNTSVYRSQKEFIENASHELQTPLAMFRAKLDMLAQQLPFTPQLGSALSELNDIVGRLAHVNKNLLLLSKIENDQFVEKTRLSIGQIIKKQVDFFSEQAQEKKIEVKADIEADATVLANPILVEIAISNLLLNAVKHNVEEGRVLVALDSKSLRIANSGIKNPLEEAKMFQRFSSPGSTGGNGLGLAILKRIADFHGWKVSYLFENNLHVFLINF